MPAPPPYTRITYAGRVYTLIGWGTTLKSKPRRFNPASYTLSTLRKFWAGGRFMGPDSHHITPIYANARTKKRIPSPVTLLKPWSKP